MTKKISNTLEIIILFVVLILTGVGLFLLYFFFNAPVLSFILVSAYVLNLLIAAHLMISSRHHCAKVSWFFILILLPILGTLVYLMFGQRYKYRMTNDQKREFYKDFYSIHSDSAPDYVSEDLKQTSNFAHRPISNGSIDILNGGDKAFPELFKSMREAKETLDVMYYILKPGEIYQEFESILVQKAKEGVKVRVILDEFGTWAMPWRKIKYLEDSGVIIKKFGRVYFPFVGSVNGYRLHRKIVIVDGKSAFTGGLNISDEYAHLSKKYGYWADIQVKLVGDIVRQLHILFFQDWYMISGENLLSELHPQEKDLLHTSDNKIVPVDSGPDNIEPLLENLLVKWILSAKKSIKLTTPYFIPTAAVTGALRTAVMSGVDVKIIIPNKPDKAVVLMASKFYAEPLIAAGVKFYWMKDTLVHTKMGIFDEEVAYFGSMNIDIRSFFSQFEVQLFFEGSAVKDLTVIFDEYLSKCTQLEIQKQLKIVKWLKAIAVRTFSPLM